MLADCPPCSGDTALGFIPALVDRLGIGNCPDSLNVAGSALGIRRT